MSGYNNIGGDNFDTRVSQSPFDAQIRIRGKHNQLDFKRGAINITMQEQEQKVQRKKVKLYL